MEGRALGRSGVTVSRVILGCDGFGAGEAASRHGAFAIIDRAFELGLTTFDVGPEGAAGVGEAWIGEWLATKDETVRDRVAIPTRTSEAGGRSPRRGLGRADIRQRVDESLARLGTERVEVCLAHAFDAAVPQEEALLALDERNEISLLFA